MRRRSALAGESSHERRERNLLNRIHLDGPLLLGLILIGLLGLAVLYSASGEQQALLHRQLIRLCLGFGILVVVAQIPPEQYRTWSPWLFLIAVVLLLAVMLFGEAGKGAQRWLNLGFVRFQPSELAKLAVPMTIAWIIAMRPIPPHPVRLMVATLLMSIPVLMIAVQPDLGTSLLVACAGFFVLFLAGLSWKLLGAISVLSIPSAWALWAFGMQDYQRQRVLTFLDPESDPLGSGYHIIQSTIAVGSGGGYGKGWTNGTQSQLDFLPERSTDFIFAVFGEEFGLLGGVVLLSLYLFIVLRGLAIAAGAQNTYNRLLAGSLSLTFLIYVFVNIGMVIGILPVVGIPLPLVSYGGTSMVTLMAGFGILMSIQTHRRLLAR